MSYEEEKQDRKIERLEAEIERLRASLTDLHAEYINTLEKNPECSAWDLDEQSIEDQRRLRRNAAHAISNVVYITGTGEIGADATKTIDQTPNSAENMQKTGPDSPKMAVWQITDERTTALDRVLNYMDYMYPKSSPYYHCTLDVSVLRAMLEEARQ